ncbi:MAG: 6-pyruvoyl tetrahydropterin synthase family protein [Promethearchaeota archaeon]
MSKKRRSSSVAIDKLSVHFSASHALILDHYEEGLHGHNYLVEMEIEGIPDNNDLIIDFIFLEKLLIQIVTEWDHYVLIPSKNKNMKMRKNKENMEIIYGERFYSIPRAEIQLLSCTNVTTEALTRLLGEKIEEKLRKEIFWERIGAITISIWETPIYWASYTIKLNSGGSQK